MNAAIDAGITLFDVADIYGQPVGRSEEMLGLSLGRRRGDVIVATKFGMDARGANGPDFGARGSRRYVRAAVEASLRRLNTDWIDLYQLHQPDPLTPIEETLAALDELVVGRDGSLRRAFQFLRMAIGGRGLGGQKHRAGAVHLGAERVLAAESGYRA